jgi:hypothetical protein
LQTVLPVDAHLAEEQFLLAIIIIIIIIIILYYLRAESTALRPITDTAQYGAETFLRSC